MSSFSLPFFFLLFSPLLASPLPEPPPIKGLLINCGSSSSSRIDGLLWLPDSPFVSTGTPKTLALPDLHPTLSTLRSFPFFPSKTSKKFCYSLPVVRHARYLVRTTFFYGAAGGQSRAPPVFDQIVDGTFWTSVNTTEDFRNGMASNYEGVFLARGKFMSVCVAGNRYTDSDPFVNSVELIVLEGSVYNSTDFTKHAMGLVARSRFGYDGPIVRYPNDKFNRYWLPFMGNTRSASSTLNISASGFWNLPPENIFNTGLTADRDDQIVLQWPPVSLPSSSYYIALYFADTSFESSRTFDVFINGNSFYSNLKVTSYGHMVFATQWNLSGSTRIILSPVSVLPPIINAGEIFGIFPLGGITVTRDVIALEKIKKSIQNPPLDWSGDPCLPHGYSWTGIACSEGPQIRVIALNLSSMGLSGSLSPSVANLTALTALSLASNNFSGPIPDLSRLRRLQKLHLQNNLITGILPQSLGKLESLHELFLENNNLTGKVPLILSSKHDLILRLSPGNHFS